MRICFIADAGSIHVRRIVSYHLRTGDDVLILSSGLRDSEIEGATIRRILKTTAQFYRDTHPTGKLTDKFRVSVKPLIPRFIRGTLKRTIRNIGLFRKRALCLAEIERFNPDVIYCFRSFPEGMLASHCSVRPVLLRTAGADISKFARYPVYRQLIRKALRIADVVVTESRWERQLVHKLCGERVEVKVNIIGVDTDIFKPSSSRRILRAKYRIPHDAFVVVSNRYLAGEYNGWLVVKAVQTILQDCPNLILLYFSPLAVDQRTKAKIELMCLQSPQIRFIDGGVPHSEVAEILSCGDVYISLSSVDGISNSVLEAMACGCVPIVADLPQLHEWIEPTSTGFMVPQRDREKVSSLIKELYQKPGELPQIASQCVSKINAEGRFEVCMGRTRGMLKRLVAVNGNHLNLTASMMDKKKGPSR